MTFVVEADDDTARRIEANLYKLVNVLSVEDITDKPSVIARPGARSRSTSARRSAPRCCSCCEVFRARAVDVGPETLIVEITGTQDKIDGLVADPGAVRHRRDGPDRHRRDDARSGRRRRQRQSEQPRTASDSPPAYATSVTIVERSMESSPASRRKPAPDYVRIFDTTLRDGEQSPGATLTSEEKLEVAQGAFAARRGRDRGRLSRPPRRTTSRPCSAIAESVGHDAVEGRPRGEPPIICGLARATEKDIRTAYDAVKDAKHPRIHTFLATSPIHREHKLRMTQGAGRGAHARDGDAAPSRCATDVEFSPEDAGRTEPEFLYEVLERRHRGRRHHAQHPGHGRLHDARRVRRAHRRHHARTCKGIENVDRLACTVTTTSAWRRPTPWPASGRRAPGRGHDQRHRRARRQHRARRGRDGAAHARSRCSTCAPASTPRSSRAPASWSACAPAWWCSRTRRSSAPTPSRTSRGIHQDGMLKHAGDVRDHAAREPSARSKTLLVLGKHSGRHAFAVRLRELGHAAGRRGAGRRVRALQAAGRQEEAHHRRRSRGAGRVRGRSRHASTSRSTPCRSRCGSNGMPTATVRLRGPDGELARSRRRRHGPGARRLHAPSTRSCKAPAELLEYTINAVTEGIDALGHASVRVRAAAAATGA